MTERESMAAFRPVQTRRASEAIYDQIREMVVSGKLQPGDRLPSERNMMELFQRSRPTIREALRMLERNGYIRTSHGANGAVILAPSDQNMTEVMTDAMEAGHIGLRDLVEYRQICEGATVAWACLRATEEDMARMREHLEHMRGLTGDYEAFSALDPQFHQLIAAAGHNRVSVSINAAFSRLNQHFFNKKMATLSAEQRQAMCERIQEMHEAILRAIEARDEAEARQAMATHITAFEDDLQE